VRSGGRNPNWSGADQGWAAACTLVAGILVWGGIGAVLDRVFGTWPILFAVGAFLGNFAAIYLIYVRHFRDAPTSVRFEFPEESNHAA
jgi:F0F1-type ATP synthase assembly protein I